MARLGEDRRRHAYLQERGLEKKMRHSKQAIKNMKRLSHEMKLNLGSLKTKNEVLLKCVSGWGRLSETAKKNLQTAVVLHQKYPERMNKEAHEYLDFYTKVQDRLLREKRDIESEVSETKRNIDSQKNEYKKYQAKVHQQKLYHNTLHNRKENMKELQRHCLFANLWQPTFA